MAPPWKKTYLDHGGSTSCGSRVFCRSVAASDQYNPCQWKPAIYGRADRGVYFRFAAEPESGILLSVNEVAVDEIRFNKEKEATLQIRSLKVELGSNSEMNGKLSELTDILRDYPDLSGTLYLDSYDESNANPMYRFDKN